MRRNRPGLCPVQKSAAGFGAAAVLLFALCAAATWGGFDPPARAIFAGAASAAAVLSGTCWAAGYRREADRQERALLIRTLAGALPAEHRAQ